MELGGTSCFLFFFMGGGLLFQFSYTANALTRSAHREPPFHCHLYIFISLIPRFPFLLLLPFLISVPCVLSYFLILNTRSFVNFVFSGVKSPVFMVFSSGGVRAPPDSDEPRGSITQTTRSSSLCCTHSTHGEQKRPLGDPLLLFPAVTRSSRRGSLILLPL